MRATKCTCVAALLVTTVFAQDPVAKGIEEFRQGSYAAAKTTLEQALKQNPGNLHARAFLALSRAATGGCDSAANDLTAVYMGQNSDLRRLAGLALSATWRTIA